MPTLLKVSVNDTTAPSSVYQGDEMQVKASASDNKNLQSLELRIHGNTDGHSHKKVDLWEKTLTKPLSGTNDEISFSLKVPDHVSASSHHMIFRTIDKGGNKSSSSVIDLNLNSNNPALKIEQPELWRHR